MTGPQRNPKRLDMNVIDPTGRTRIFRAQLPELPTTYRDFGYRWDAGQPRPTLVLDGVERPDVPLKDRFAVGGQNGTTPDR